MRVLVFFLAVLVFSNPLVSYTAGSLADSPENNGAAYRASSDSTLVRKIDEAPGKESPPGMSAIKDLKARVMATNGSHDGQPVVVQGVVFSQNEAGSSGSIYIQDQTGGIRLWFDRVPTIAYGEKIRARGRVNITRGTHDVFLDNPTFETLTQDCYPLPVFLRIPNFASSNVQVGSLVSLSGTAVRIGGDHFHLSDGTRSILVQSNGNHDVSSINDGGRVAIQGVCQFNGSELYLSLPAQAKVFSLGQRTTHFVDPDGSGDFPTIQDAIIASSDGDIIELLDGTFTGPGNRAIDFYDKAVTLRSNSGNPESCVLDAQNKNLGFVFHRGETRSSRIENITITNGNHGPAGGAILINLASPSIDGCVFRSNLARYGAAVAIGGGSPLFTDCLFELNEAVEEGGSAYCNNAEPKFVRCIFRGNSAFRGAAIFLYTSPALIESCTFFENTEILEDGGVICCWFSSFPTITQTIIAFNPALAVGQRLQEDIAYADCSDIFGNSGGDWVQGVQNQGDVDGNLSVDPQFCDQVEGNLTLDEESPCAVVNNLGCGQIGALPVGCGVIFGLDCVDYAEFSAPPTPFIGSIDTGGECSSVAVAGNLAFVADGSNGLVVVDISLPSLPAIVGTMDTPGTGSGVAISRNHLVMADGETGLLVIDVSTPTEPTIVGKAATEGFAQAVEVAGNFAYVADMAGGLKIVDLTRPSNPVVLGAAFTPGDARGLKVAGRLAYVAAGSAGLQVVDVSHPTLPTIIGSVDTPGDAAGIELFGNVAYLADGASVQVIDVSIPSSPAIFGAVNPGDHSYALRLAGEYLYVADRVTGIQVYDHNDGQIPVWKSTIFVPGQAYWVASFGELIYLADYPAGLRIGLPQCATGSSVATLVPQPAEMGPIGCHDPAPLSFFYSPSSNSAAVKGYSVRILAESSISFSASDFTVNNLPPEEDVLFQIVENGFNDFTLDYTILGSTTNGITSPAFLFSILLHGLEDGSAVLSISAAEFRDLDNQSVPVDFSSVANVLVECGPPSVVSEVLANPGHERVTVTWTDVPDVDISSVSIFRGLWHDGALESAYPDYGQLAGSTVPSQFLTFPQYLNSSEWVLAGSVGVGTEEFVDSIPTRGIYFYQVFAVDEAGNVGPPLAVSPASTNYLLGDVAIPYDGQIGVADISLFGSSYGTSCGHQDYNAEMDIGPTESGNSHGTPVPDCQIGFEDLMVIGFNFGPAPKAKTLHLACDELNISWVQQSELEWSCMLSQPCPSLKGLHLVDLGQGWQNAAVQPGSLLSEQTAQVIVQKADTQHLDIGLVVMGADQGIAGEGELLRITLAHPLSTFSPTLEARGTNNRELAIKLVDPAVPMIPTRYALGHNYPNPFNPSTTISFSLPETHEVHLGIYSIDGRRVCTLASGLKPAGRYEIQWEGRDDRDRAVASGIYFYRFEAGAFSETRKMVLMK
jgi:hypothetical protein